MYDMRPMRLHYPSGTYSKQPLKPIECSSHSATISSMRDARCHMHATTPLVIFRLSHSDRDMSSAVWSRPVYDAPYVQPALVSIDRTPPTPQLLSSIVSAGAAPCPLSLPSLWPYPSTDLLSRVTGTTAWLSWNESGLHALFDVCGPFLSARSVDSDKLTIHNDSRVEVFVCPTSAADTNSGAMRYCGFEFNSAGRCLDFAVTIDETGERQFDYSWKGNAVGVMQQKQSKEHATIDSSTEPSRLYRVSIPWQDIGLSPAQVSSGTAELLVGLYRGEVVDPSSEHAEHLWINWVDPLSPDVSFHTHRTFARVRLMR